MNEEMKTAFKKSDRTLNVQRYLLLAIAILIAIGGIVVGIYFWANSSRSYYSYYGGYRSSTNGAYIGIGFGCFFGGPILGFLFYYFSMIHIWTLFDLKVIRTIVSGAEFSPTLLSFGKKKEKENEPKPAEETKKAEQAEQVEQTEQTELPL